MIPSKTPKFLPVGDADGFVIGYVDTSAILAWESLSPDQRVQTKNPNTVILDQYGHQIGCFAKTGSPIIWKSLDDQKGCQ